MNIAQYTFQSPYPSPIQVGRLDPSSVKNSSNEDTSFFNASNQTLKEAQTFENSLKNEVKPAVESSNSLDIYA